MLNIQENVNIKDYCTLKVGGFFRYFCVINDTDDLKQALVFAKNNSLNIFVLGGGSNLVFDDGVLEMLVLKIEIKNFEIINDDISFTDIKIGAGNNWDEFVAQTVSMNLSGLESLSAIPGTCGATPVQNVGAYGQEVSNVIVNVEVFDTHSNEIKILENRECDFSYRDSIFKKQGKDRYIITSVLFRLSKNEAKIPDYPGVAKYFKDMNIMNPNLLQIREAIIFIRSTKLPDPKIIANVGSFFKNPILKRELAEAVKNSNPNISIFELNPIDSEFVKVPAGALIEQAGLKGKSFGAISVYDKNALVLVNNGNATFLDLENAKDKIIKTVQDKFNITLVPEPEFVK